MDSLTSSFTTNCSSVWEPPLSGCPRSVSRASGAAATTAPTVHQVLSRYAERFYESHWGRFTAHQRHVLDTILACRQARSTGVHRWHCEWCGHTHLLANNCHHRHCPQCGGSKRARWLDRVASWCPPVEYLHIVFTLPHEFVPLIVANAAPLYRLLFRSAGDTLLSVAAERYAARPGLAMVLHTWGQRMNPHPHTHVVQTGGGLALAEDRWVPMRASDEALSAAVLAEEFQRRYVQGVIKLCRQQKLSFAGPLAGLRGEGDLRRWLQPVMAKRWCVDCQAPPPECGPGDGALKYLARYVTGTAIHDGRILRDDGRTVVIRIKDYRRDCERQLAMPGEEFVARFVFHILPRRMQRVRFAGLFQPNVRKRRVALCHRLLAGRDKPPAPEVHRPLKQQREPAQENSPEAAEPTEATEATEAAEPLRRDPAPDPAGAHDAATDQASPHAAGALDVPWEPERPPRICPRCLMPGLRFMGRLRPDEARRLIGRLEWLLRGMITIVTTLEVPPLPGRQRRPPPFGDAPVEWVLDVGCDVRAAHIRTVIDTLPAPDT